MPVDIQTQPRLVEIAIEAKSKAEQEKLRIAVATLAAEDSTFEVSIDPESGQTILKGTSELHVAATLDTIGRIYNIAVNIGAPQVAFLERPTRRVEVEYVHKKVHGPKGEFAAVKLAVEPNESGRGYHFKSRIVGNAVPEEYILAVQKGLESVLSSGVVAGFPVIDVKVELIDGMYHDIDSSPRAFEIASRAAFREALLKAESVLLEPIMKVEVVTPEDYVASLISDLKLRRGRIQDQRTHGGVIAIDASVPLMNMFGYVNNLRVMSRGRATFTMHFDRYAPTPLPEGDPPFRPAIGMRA